MKIQSFYLCFLILLTTTLYSQQDEYYRKYLTQQKNHELNSLDPEYFDRKKQIEEYIASYNSENNELINLTIYFQVLYTGEESSIKLEDLESQISTLNDFFNGENPIIKDSINIHQQQFLELKANPNINFCFVEENVNFKQVDSNFEENLWNILFSDLGGSNPILPEKYINIYIADLEDNFAGFANQPWTKSPYNGIVLNSKFLKQKHPSEKFNSGKSLAHLMGSYLGLLELWDEYKPCTDDYVKDTPIQYAPSNYTPDKQVKVITFCGEKTTEAMTINLMDNTHDDGLNLLTLGQKTRIRGMLSGEGALGYLTIENNCNENKAQSRKLEKEWIKVSPNPTTSNYVINYLSNSEGNVTVEILNATGIFINKSVKKAMKGNNEFSFDCKDFHKGFFIIRVKGTNNQIHYSNLIIQ